MPELKRDERPMCSYVRLDGQLAIGIENLEGRRLKRREDGFGITFGPTLAKMRVQARAVIGAVKGMLDEAEHHAAVLEIHPAKRDATAYQIGNVVRACLACKLVWFDGEDEALCMHGTLARVIGIAYDVGSVTLETANEEWRLTLPNA